MAERERYFTGPWLIQYVDGLGEKTERFISADYKIYDEERIIQILNEAHPEWTINKVSKVEKLPWAT